MAWGDSEDEIIKQAKFNPALFKMQEIHKINDFMNECKLNLMAWNIEKADWNFNLWINSINNLFFSVSSKFSDEEVKECLKLKDAIEICKEKYPVKEMTRKKIIDNNENFSILKKYAEKYEQKVKEYQDKHGMDVPEMDESSLF